MHEAKTHKKKKRVRPNKGRLQPLMGWQLESTSACEPHLNGPFAPTGARVHTHTHINTYTCHITVPKGEGGRV